MIDEEKNSSQSWCVLVHVNMISILQIWICVPKERTKYRSHSVLDRQCVHLIAREYKLLKKRHIQCVSTFCFLPKRKTFDLWAELLMICTRKYLQPSTTELPKCETPNSDLIKQMAFRLTCAHSCLCVQAQRPSMLPKR